MFHSIRLRIAVTYVLVIVVMMTALAIYLTGAVRDSTIANLEPHLERVAALVAEASQPALQSGADVNSIDSLTKKYARLTGLRVTIIAPDGNVLGESEEDRTLMDNHLNRAEVAQALSAGEGMAIRSSRTTGILTFYKTLLVKEGDTVLGVVRVAMPMQQIDSQIRRLKEVIAVATILAIVITILLAAFIASRTTLPLRELTQTVEEMSERSKLGQRFRTALTPMTYDEVGKLTSSINVLSSLLDDKMEALETERDKLAAVLREMSDGVIIVDGQSQVQLINPAVESLFGVQKEKASGHTLAEVFRYHQLVEVWERAHKSGEVQTTTLETSDKKYYLQVVAAPLGVALPGNLLLLVQNLTQQKITETMRRDFISNVSHELRTPLAALKALTETLLEGALNDPPAARRFLEGIETEVDALSLMVTELLELSRIESGRVPLQIEPTEVCEIINPAVERLKLQAERAELKVTVEYDPDLPYVMADAGRLEQVMVNLIHNAIKFTSAVGEINVRAVQEGQMIVFSVRDTGVGIPPDDLPRIFERFFKTDRARAGGGTGLGLSIARHLVEAHAGKIWAESVEGKGSTFFFAIPLAQSNPP